MMKRTLFLTALAVCVVSLIAEEVAGGGASTMDISRYRNVGLLNAEAYAKKVNDDINFVSKAKLADMPRAIQIAGLDGAPNKFDTAEEITLLSATRGVINIRPVEAAGMLPADDPVLVDLQLGAMLYMKKAAVSFLGNGDPAKYAAELKFITDRGRITNADIENFVKQGIAVTVDEEFNKVSGFMIDRKYNVVLIRNPQNGQYELNYEGVENVTKKLSASSLEALSSAMSKSGDFSATAFDTVRAQAALIPAVAIAQTGTMDVFLGTVKKALTDFYVNPTITNYNTVKDIYALFMRRVYEYHQDPLFGKIRSSYGSALSELNISLFNKVSSEANQEKYAAVTLTQTQIRNLTVRR